MSGRSKFLFYAMIAGFATSAFGVVLGLIYGTYATVVQHRDMESILRQTMPYHRIVGSIGVLAFLLLVCLLLSAMIDPGATNKNDRKH